MNHRVTRCVCADMTFAEWLAVKEREGWTLEQACDNTTCGRNCGMCWPYLRVVAATGRVELPPMIPEDLERLAD